MEIPRARMKWAIFDYLSIVRNGQMLCSAETECRRQSREKWDVTFYFRFRSFRSGATWKMLSYYVHEAGRTFTWKPEAKPSHNRYKFLFVFSFSAKKALVSRRNRSKKNVMLRMFGNAGQQFVSFSIFPILNTFLA